MSAVRDNSEASRYELDTPSGPAFIDYRRHGGVAALVHAEVPQALQGQGIGSQLAQGVLELARAQGLKILPRCPFIAAYIQRHPQYQDLLA
ncbi:MAG TPA: GNAT family N-acetyltransferase [Steroidobacteraceae bacterium]|nr:GNAT family N-acetyltransferase [Steroidobacteraceae bacterium]